MTNLNTTTRAHLRKRMCAHMSCLCIATDGEEYCGTPCQDAEAELWKSRIKAVTWPVHSGSDRSQQVVLICKVYKAC